MMKRLGLFVVLSLFGSTALAQVTGGINLGPGSSMPPTSSVAPGTVDHPAVQFMLFTTTPQTFDGITINNMGTAGASDCTRVSLYEDTNGDGMVDPGDSLIHVFSGTSFPVFGMFNTPYMFGFSAGGGPQFLVSIDVSSSATGGATFVLQIRPPEVLCSMSVGGIDVQGNVQTVTTSGPPPVNITTTTLNDGAVSVAYNETIQASGGTAPYTWSEAGIPGFLTLNTASTGLSTTLTGTPGPGDAGTYSFSVTITDSVAQSDTQPYTINIIGSGAGVAIITTSLPNGTEGLGYNQTIDTGGGTAPFSWTLESGTLPTGLTLDTGSTASSTTLSGIPTAAGIFNFTVRVDDAAGFDTEFYTVVIDPAGGGTGGTGGGRRGGGGSCAAGADPAHLWFLLPLFVWLALAIRRTKESR